METTDFYPRTFTDIPEQDNPAFAPRALRFDGMPIKTPNLMIVRQQNQKIAPNVDHNEQVLVLLIDDPANVYDRVTALGKFWKHSVAKQFCDKFVL